jgi:predicted MFS family arabinose efflux permease
VTGDALAPGAGPPASGDAVAPAAVRRARQGITVVFFVVGLQISAWFTQIPQIKSGLRLSDGALGLALLCPAAGALLTMQVSGRLARRRGSAPVVRLSGAVMAATLPLIGLARSPGALAAALFIVGLADGLLDVSMNAHAIAVESAAGRPILQSMHASFSLGTILGAAAGWAAIAAGASPLTFLSIVAVASLASSLTGTARLLPARADQAPAAESPGGGQRAKPGWSLFVVVLGLLGAGCLFAGGAAENWTAVFLRSLRHLTPATATAGYLGFTVATLAGRLAGDRLHRRLGPVTLVRAASVVAGLGLAAALFLPGEAVAISGFAVYGLGLSVLVPVIYGAVGHGSAGQFGAAEVAVSVTRFTTISYTGFLAGPAVIGWLAQSLGLALALGSALLVLVATFALAGFTRTALPGGSGPAREGEPAHAAL